MNFAGGDSKPEDESEQTSSPPSTNQQEPLPDTENADVEVVKPKKKKGARGLAKFLTSTAETQNTIESSEPIIEDKKEEDALELSFKSPDNESQAANPESNKFSPEEHKLNENESPSTDSAKVRKNKNSGSVKQSMLSGSKSVKSSVLSASRIHKNLIK
jgi:hypothetical protein